MMQQVNLYSDILRHQQQQSGIKFGALLIGVLIGLLALFSLYLWWHSTTTAAEVSRMQNFVTQQQDKLNALTAKRSGNVTNPALLAELDRWQNSVNEAAQTLQILNAREFSQAKGFSTYLKALALRPSPEVWLTAIHIDGNNQSLTLEGSTFKPDQLPQTLQKLQSAPALKGLSFAKLKMLQSEKIPGQIDFILSSPEIVANGKNDAL